MSPSPLETMIDASVKCLICGSRLGACNCWVKVTCPDCGKRASAKRTEQDPVRLHAVTYPCPDCDRDDGTLPIHFDAAGRVIPIEEVYP